MPRKAPRTVNFTKANIEGLAASPDARLYHYDEKINGLAVCVTPAGTKIFYVVRRIGMKVERIRLGAFPEVTVEQARTEAAKHNGTIASGGNPAERRRAVAGAPTLGELFAEFIVAPTRTKEKRPRSPVTTKGYRYLFEEHLAEWQDRQVSRIDRNAIEALHNRIGKERPYLANRVLSLLKAVFEFAVEQRLYGTNPAARLRPFQEEQRERFLQADELPRFFEALEAEPSEKVRDFLKVALFTGQRRTNVLTMKWEDVNLTRATWSIPRTKSGKSLVVPLSSTAVEILTRRFASRTASPYVFPGRHDREHLRDPMRQWRGILERAGLPGLRIHDLRRTFGSWQTATGASLPVVGKSLGHARPETTAIYARLELSPVRAAVEAATDAMLKAAAAGKEGDA